MEETHRERFLIRSFDLDVTGRVSPRALCGFLQEAAGEHAVRLGVGQRVLVERNLAWALHRLRIELDETPGHGAVFEVQTWPSALERLYAHRDFLLHHEGRVIGRATSAWIVFDLVTRRAGKVLEALGEIPVAGRPRAAIIQAKKPPLPSSPEVERSFRVRRGDLDTNAHTNNGCYADWVIETVPERLWQTHRLSSIELVFRAESVYGDTLIAASQRLDDAGLRWTSSITRTTDGVELARAETVLAPAGN